MLSSISISNFKPFGEHDADITLGRITIFIGENGTGKSSVLQSLAVLRQSVGGNSLKQGPFQFSSYGDLVHLGHAKRDLRIAFSGAAAPQAEQAYVIPFHYEVTFADPGELVYQRGTLELEQVADLGRRFGVEGALVGEYSHGDSWVTTERVGTDEAYVTIRASKDICMPILVTGGGYGSGSFLSEFHRLNDELRSVFSLFSDSMNKVLIDYALRGLGRQSYPLEAEAKLSPVAPEEVFSTFAYRRDIEQKVSMWLTKITGTSLSVNLIPGREIKLKDGDGFDIYQGGFGTNQLIRPLVLLAVSSPEFLIAIEEAEISLHPRAQVKFCDVVTDIAMEENKQILLTTHSEHILTGFLNLVAEGRLAPMDLSIYFFEKDGREAKVNRLKVDEKGAIQGGLRSFFEVNLDSYERHLKALSRRAKR